MLLAAAFVAAAKPAAAQVKVWQGTMSLPTYEEGPPDPNPPFDQYAPSNRFNYPYTIRNNLTDVKETHTWRAIFLENEYLKCSILPDLGGHIYTCIDKISGQPMFYANPSIKKAQIGYRGAWAAFGVEFNFPVSHNWVSVSPVDFAYATHKDGSASVWVGNIDRVYGMQWQVELVMRPGSTLLEQRTTLANRSDVRHRYYWWNNAGIEVWDDSRIDYPMRFVASHGFTNVYAWPVGPQGDRDLSIIKNQTLGPVSYFAHGTEEPFMGVWNPHTQSGTAHFAAHQDVPAKKIWSWGVDSGGLHWRTVLSDNDSAYVEMQAGLFRNQETYAFLEPGQFLHFSEYWMPVRGIGGISRANETGVMHFNDRDSDVTVALNVNERIPGARISLTRYGIVLWSGVADLSPEKTWSRTVPRSEGSGKLTFELRNRAGQSLLKQTEGEYDWASESSIRTGPQMAMDFPDPERRSEDDWLEIGRGEELNGALLEALDTYRQALERFPQSQSLLVAAGRLDASLQQYDEAARLLQMAQMRDTTNSEIAYYLGIAEEGLGNEHDAQASYETAYRQADLRASAAIRLAELHARQCDLDDAAVLLRSATSAQPANVRAAEELEAVLRAHGNLAEADELAQRELALDPASDFLKADTGAPDLAHLAADPYRVLRVAAEYMRLGLYAKALTLLDRRYPAVAPEQGEPGSVLPQSHPMVRYYAAYCRQKLGEAKPDWQAARELSTSYVFPSSETDRMVLEAALATDPDDATAHFLLGTLLFFKGSTDAAIAHWSESKRLDPDRPVLDADLGDALLRLKSDPEGAVAAYREGVHSDPENPEVYMGLDAAMSLLNTPASERAAALGQYPAADSPATKMPANLVYQLALARAEAGEFAPALTLFEGRFFPGAEGGISAAQARFEIELMQAEAWSEAHNCPAALAFVANVQSGNNVEGISSREDVELATIARNCGRVEEANGFFEKASAGGGPGNLPWAIEAEQALGKGNPEDARDRLTHALAVAEENAETGASSGSWCYSTAMLELALGDKERARQLLKKTLVLPNVDMSHHFARLALATMVAGE
jgi:tetratricopeptide (TPR) repeat protein